MKSLKHKMNYILQGNKVAQMVKHMPTMQGTQVQSLGGEDLEKEIVAHSSTLAWKIPWMEEPGRLGRLQSMGVAKSWT